MRVKTFKSWMAAAACACILPLSVQAFAIYTDAIGSFTPGVSASTAQDTALVNTLLGFANGGSDPSDASYTYAVFNAGSYPTPAVAVGTGAVGGDHSVNLLTGGYAYLMVKYDGAQGSAFVFDVRNLTGSIFVPQKDANNKTHNNYTLFNASTSDSVPDGGSTLALAGIALAALGILRRKVN